MGGNPRAGSFGNRCILKMVNEQGEIIDRKTMDKLLPIIGRLICRDEEFEKIKQETVWRLFDENEKDKTN